MDAKAWFYGQSFVGGLESEQAPKAVRPERIAVEQWDGEKWIKKVCVWDGEKYVAEKENK